MTAAIHGVYGGPGGQNPNSETTAYDAQLNNLFGGGQPAPSLGGAATRADVPFGMKGITTPPPKMPPGGFATETDAFDYQQLITEWMRDQQAALDPTDGNYKENLASITAVGGALFSGAQEWHKIAYTKGVDQANMAFAQEKFRAENQQNLIKNQQWEQGFGLETRKFDNAMIQQGFENELALAKFGREGDVARGWIDGEPTLARQQYESEQEMGFAGLSGQMPERFGGGRTLQGQTLDETIELNRNNLRKGFAEFQSQQDIALMGARQNALKLAQEQAQNAAVLDPTGQYLAGREPGGMVSSLRGSIGMPFTPIGAGQLTPGPNPREGLAELEEAFRRRAQEYPQPRY